MTHTEMHRALCGWINPGSTKRRTVFGETVDDACWEFHHPPLTLDWLHEVEAKALGPFVGPDWRKWQDYSYKLCCVTGNTWDDYRAAIHATKHQRLEALCRTLGLVKEKEAV